jgi:hypothetical protein
MSLESFRAPKRNSPSFFRRFRQAIDNLVGTEEPNEREVFSPDGNRKWVFFKWKWGEDAQSGQLNAALVVRIGDSWVGLMQGMMRWDGEDEPEYGLEVSGVNANGQNRTYYYDNSTGGRKRFSGMTGKPMGISSEDARLAMLDEGVLAESELPEHVDFETTIKLFLGQAGNLDFSTPILVEKPLIE